MAKTQHTVALRKEKPENDIQESSIAPRKSKNGATQQTKMKMEEFAAEIAKTAMPRRTAIKWAVERYGVAEATASVYYAAAMRYLRPDDPQKYREELIDRNFAILEEMLQTALKRGDLKNANAIINTLNRMVGISGNKVEIKDESQSGTSKTITISFA